MILESKGYIEVKEVVVFMVFLGMLVFLCICKLFLVSRILIKSFLECFFSWGGFELLGGVLLSGCENI